MKEAGVGYRLGFNATGLTSTFEGGSYVESSAFTVGVGPAYQLELEADILDGDMLSGSPFEDQVRGLQMRQSVPSERHYIMTSNDSSAKLHTDVQR